MKNIGFPKAAEILESKVLSLYLPFMFALHSYKNKVICPTVTHDVEQGVADPADPPVCGGSVCHSPSQEQSNAGPSDPPDGVGSIRRSPSREHANAVSSLVDAEAPLVAIDSMPF